MGIRRHTVLWLTLSWAVALILISDIVWFLRGGADGLENERLGVLVPAAQVGPDWGEPVAVLPADDDGNGAPDAALVERTLAPLLADPRLGSRVSVSVLDAETGTELLARDAEVSVAPASTTKIVTAAAVLATYNATTRLYTRVVRGSTPGEIVLIGGGDPTLALGEKGAYPGAARLDLLAASVRTQLTEPVTRVVVDDGLFTGPTTGPGWDADIVAGGYAAPVMALTVDGGRARPTPDHTTARVADPALHAGRKFAELLEVPDASVVRGTAEAGAEQLGTLASPPLVHLVELMLRESDNVIAEALARLVAVKRNQPGTFTGAAEAVRAALGELGVDMTGFGLVDGSGLSRSNRLTPELLTAVLGVAADPERPRLRPLLAGLPVGAYSGTLAGRFDGTDTGAGTVRAKTGTLSGVSSLAGVVHTADGQTLAFAMMADRVPGGGTLGAEAALDRAAAALASCGC